mgnify:CR=1 FL=1
MRLDGMKIAVIGAGIGGLAAARALALRGADVTVLEQAAETAEVGAGLQISPNGFAVLAALGLGEALRSVRGRAVQLVDYRGAGILALDLGRLARAGYHFVHRADLIDLHRVRFRRVPGTGGGHVVGVHADHDEHLVAGVAENLDVTKLCHVAVVVDPCG